MSHGIAAAAPPQSRALLVGMANSDPRLPQATASLEVVQHALTSTTKIVAAKDCALLHDPPTPDVVLERVRQAAAAATDVLLLYVVAQIGINGQTGTPMLATAGVRPDDYLVTGLSLDALLDAVDTGDAQFRIILLDLVARFNASVAPREWRADYLTKASRNPGTCLVISQIQASDLPRATQQTAFAKELSALLASVPKRSAAAVTVRQLAEGLETELGKRRAALSVRSQVGEHVADHVIRPAHPQPWPDRGMRAALARLREWVLARCKELRWGWALIAAGAAVVLVATVSVVLLNLTGSTAACRPPLELRVLASPESYPAVHDAAGQYSKDRLDANECRTVHLTVYQATTDAVLRAFGQADQWAQPVGEDPGPASPCAATALGVADATLPGNSAKAGLPAPGRDLGPQPDVWFADSVVDVERAKACLPPASSAVTFTDPVPVARSPLVLGVPESRPGFPSTGQLLSWEDLLNSTITAKLDLRRPNPTTSTAGLLHSVGLYEAVTGSPQGQLSPDRDLNAVRDLENLLVGQGVSVVNTEDLLCTLDPDRPVPAVLVSERALLSYNLGRLSGCPGLPGQGRGLLAYYPTDLLVLDYPMVRLTWASQTGDADQRRAAAQGFQDWLLSHAGQQLLTRYGLRPVRDNVPQDPDELLAKPRGGAWRDAPVDTDGRRPIKDEVQSAIDYYVKARAPGRAVFLLDVSSSMAAQGNMDTAKRLIGGAIDLMGPGDEAALMRVPKSTDDPGPEPRDPQYANADILRAQLVGAALVRNDAALYDAIGMALRAMNGDNTTAKRTLVVITEGEDFNDEGDAITRAQVDQTLGNVSAPAEISIHVLALSPDVCDPQNFARLLADESGGQCISVIDSATATKLGASIFAGSNRG